MKKTIIVLFLLVALAFVVTACKKEIAGHKYTSSDGSLVYDFTSDSLVTVKSGKITIQNMEYVIEDDKITIYMKKPVVLNTGTIEDGGDTMIINGETLHRD